MKIGNKILLSWIVASIMIFIIIFWLIWNLFFHFVMDMLSTWSF